MRKTNRKHLKKANTLMWKKGIRRIGVENPINVGCQKSHSNKIRTKPRIRRIYRWLLQTYLNCYEPILLQKSVDNLRVLEYDSDFVDCAVLPNQKQRIIVFQTNQYVWRWWPFQFTLRILPSIRYQLLHNMGIWLFSHDLIHNPQLP